MQKIQSAESVELLPDGSKSRKAFAKLEAYWPLVVKFVPLLGPRFAFLKQALPLLRALVWLPRVATNFTKSRRWLVGCAAVALVILGVIIVINPAAVRERNYLPNDFVILFDASAQVDQDADAPKLDTQANLAKIEASKPITETASFFDRTQHTPLTPPTFLAAPEPEKVLKAPAVANVKLETPAPPKTTTAATASTPTTAEPKRGAVLLGTIEEVPEASAIQNTAATDVSTTKQ